MRYPRFVFAIIALVILLSACSFGAAGTPTGPAETAAPAPAPTGTPTPAAIPIPSPTAVPLSAPTHTPTPATAPTPHSGGPWPTDSGTFVTAEGVSFVPPAGWYTIGRWDFLPREVQYLFRTVPVVDSLGIPGQIDLVVRIRPNTTVEEWISQAVPESHQVKRRERVVDGRPALQIDFDQHRDPAPTELAAGTHLLIQDGDRLVLFSAFGIDWDDYAPYAAQVETIFESVAFEAGDTPSVQSPQSTAPADEYGGQWRHYSLSKEVYQVVARNYYEIWMLTEDGLSYHDFSIALVEDFAPQNWLDNKLSFAMEPSGQLWVGYVYGAPFAPGDYVALRVSRFDDAPWDGQASDSFTFSYTFEYPSDQPHIAIDSKDNLWAASPSGRHVAKFDGQAWSEFKWLGTSGRINGVMADRDGRLWLGGTDGAYVFDGERLSQLVSTGVKAVAEDDAGQIWFGTEHDGVVRFDGNASTTYTMADGLVSNEIQDIAVDHQGHLWAAFQGQAAVSQFDGTTWKTHPAPDGPIFNQVYDIAIDDLGHVWLGTDVGVSEFVPSENLAPSLAPSHRVALVNGSDLRVMGIHLDSFPGHPEANTRIWCWTASKKWGSSSR